MCNDSKWKDPNLVPWFKGIGFVMSVILLVVEIWLLLHVRTGCEKLAHQPVIVLDVLLVLLTFAGMVATWCRVKWLLWIYLPAMFLMMVMMVLLFSLFVSTGKVVFKGADKDLPGRGYMEYKLGNYPHWLQKWVSNVNRWNRFKSCLHDSRLCSDFSDKFSNDTAALLFYSEWLSALQSGCCMPPNDCNLAYVRPTVWKKTNDTVYTTNPDCHAWTNDPDVLCYSCQSCKAGLLDYALQLLMLPVLLLPWLITGYSIALNVFWSRGFDNW